MKTWNNAAMTVVCVILGIILAWQFQSIRTNAKQNQLLDKSMEQLRDSIIMEKNNNEQLRTKATNLQNELESYKALQGNTDELYKKLNSELKQAKMIAGLTDVKGKGLIITIDGDSMFYLDYDILLILNELRASDVQAISINDQRVSANTEVRKAGNYIVVNNVQMMLPIEIKAIAEPTELKNALNIAGGVLDTLKDTWKIEVKTSDEIMIPKIPDDGTVLRTDLLTPLE